MSNINPNAIYEKWRNRDIEFQRNYNNGNPHCVVPYEETLFNDGVIYKRAPHPSSAVHAISCTDMHMNHDMWPYGFTIHYFHTVDGDPDERVDFIEKKNIFYRMYKTYDKEQEWSYEACSDLSVGDGCYPAFSDKEAVFVHCMNL